MRKDLLHFLHPTFPQPGELGILKETRTIWGLRTMGLRSHQESLFVPCLLLPVFLLLLSSFSFSLSPPPLPHTHTYHVFVHPQSFATTVPLAWSTVSLELPSGHCSNIMPVLKPFQNLNRLRQMFCVFFSHGALIARNSYSVVIRLFICLSSQTQNSLWTETVSCVPLYLQYLIQCLVQLMFVKNVLK